MQRGTLDWVCHLHHPSRPGLYMCSLMCLFLKRVLENDDIERLKCALCNVEIVILSSNEKQSLSAHHWPPNWGQRILAVGFYSSNQNINSGSGMASQLIFTFAPWCGAIIIIELMLNHGFSVCFSHVSDERDINGIPPGLQIGIIRETSNSAWDWLLIRRGAASVTNQTVTGRSGFAQGQAGLFNLPDR